MYLAFYEKLNSLPEQEYIENFIVYNTSTVIARVKPASILNFSEDSKSLYSSWKIYGRNFVKEIDLEYVELREADSSIIVLVYSENIMKEYITNEKNREFLMRIGYPKEISVKSYIETLKARYMLHHCPHELGVFLGIPIEDVKDFMECTNKKCLLCGYWKVYNNYYAAEKTFKQYDIIKEHTINSFIRSNNAIELVESIKKNFLLRCAFHNFK